jgi:hypothetical protein
MNATMTLVVSVFVAFVLPGAAVAWIVLRSRLAAANSGLALLATSFGLGPGLVGVSLYALFWVAPGQPAAFYGAATAGVFLAVIAAFEVVRRRSRGRQPTVTQELASENVHHVPTSIGGFPWARVAAALVLVCVLLVVFYTAILFPFETHDATQHAYIGRLLAMDRSLQHVPLTQPLTDGFSENVRYAPGLHLVYAWQLLFTGSGGADVGLRATAPLFFLLTTLLIWAWGDALRKGSGVFAALAFATLPILTSETAINSIDAPRLFFSVCGVFWTYRVATGHRSAAAWVLAAVGIALAPFFHTLGLTTLVAAGAFVLLEARGSLMKRVARSAALVAPSCALLALEIARRFLATGTALGPSLYIPMSRQEILQTRGLQSFIDILGQGVLGVFTQPQSYGIVVWLFAGWILWEVSRRGVRRNAHAAWLGIAFIGSAVFVWVAPMTPPGWANVRYILSAIPFAALGSGLLIAGFADSLERRVWEWATANPQALARFRYAIALALLLGTVAALGATALCTPAFVASHLSADGVLSTQMVALVRMARSLLVIGSACVLILAGLSAPKRRPAARWAVVGVGAVAVLLGCVAHGWWGAARFALVGAGALLLVLAGVAQTRRRREPGRSGLMVMVIAGAVPVVAVVTLLFVPALVGGLWNKGVRPDNGFALSIARLSDEEKLLRTDAGWITSVLFTNRGTPEDAVILFTEEAPFPYYTTRRGVFWRDNQLADVYAADSAEAAAALLRSHGITHIQLSHRRTSECLYAQSQLPAVLADPRLSRPIWSCGEPLATTVYQLRD